MKEDLKSRILDKKSFKAVTLKDFAQHLRNNDNRAKMRMQSEIIPSELKIKFVKSINHTKNKNEECGEIVDNFVSIISELHKETVIKKKGRTLKDLENILDKLQENNHEEINEVDGIRAIFKTATI